MKKAKTLAQQISAVNMAIRDISRDLLKALEKGDKEWIEDDKSVIDGLEATRVTLLALQDLQNSISEL
jgi:ribosome recycling factor